MVYRRPSRLYRRLKPTAPLFQFTTETGTDLRDDYITGVTVHRGAGDPGGGVAASTLEVGLSVFGTVQSGRHCELNLTTYGAQLLAGLVDTDAALIRPRFYGRMGKQSVDDRGTRQFTTMLASSWTAQIGRVAKSYTPPVGTNVATVISELMTSPALPRIPTPVRAAAPGQYGTVHTETDALSGSDLDRWTAGLGIKVRELRSGQSQIYTHAQRWASALDAMASWVPVVRSQALAPAEWQQDTDVMPRNQRVTWGSGVGTNSDVWGDVTDSHALVVDHDMTHARFGDETQPRAEGYRLRALEWESAYSIPKLEIDLLHLITSERQYDRDQARRLLNMHEGDPVFLSGDWHSHLQGIHFATEITETISPSGWNISLSLAPSHLVVGEVSPTVPARVWDSATYPWSDESRTWNAA